MKLIILTFILLIPMAHAELFKVTGGSDGGLKKLSPNIRLLGTFRLMSADLISADQTTVKERTMSGFGADIVVGYSLGPVLLGGGGEYLHWNQAEGPEGSNETNYSGSSTDYFGVLGFSLGKLLFLGKYYLQSTYKVDNNNSLGQSVELDGARNSFSLGLVYRAWKRGFLGLEYRKLIYTEQSLDGKNSGLSSDEEIGLAGFGLNGGLFF